MKFMVIVKATPQTEAGEMPGPELFEAMGKFNEEMIDAGVMIAGEGLMESRRGARLRFSNGKHAVIDGPFAETRELIAGFWIWNCSSLQEAIDWVAKCPIAHGQDRFEIRQMHELEDFATEGEGYEQHKKVEAELAAQKSGG